MNCIYKYIYMYLISLIPIHIKPNSMNCRSFYITLICLSIIRRLIVLIIGIIVGGIVIIVLAMIVSIIKIVIVVVVVEFVMIMRITRGVE